jgi:sialic acid synthase SpsE
MSTTTRSRPAAKREIFKSFSAWQEAREKQIFGKAQKERLKDSSVKFHLEKAADGVFMLHAVKRGTDASGKETWVVRPGEKVGK